jgi:hypothetical protein
MQEEIEQITATLFFRIRSHFKYKNFMIINNFIKKMLNDVELTLSAV